MILIILLLVDVVVFPFQGFVSGITGIVTKPIKGSDDVYADVDIERPEKWNKI